MGAGGAPLRGELRELCARGCPPLRELCGGVPPRFGDSAVLEGNLNPPTPPLPLRHVVLWGESGALCGIIWRAEPGVECHHPPPPPPLRAGAMGRGQGSAHVLGPCLWRCLLTAIKAVEEAFSTLIEVAIGRKLFLLFLTGRAVKLQHEISEPLSALGLQWGHLCRVHRPFILVFSLAGTATPRRERLCCGSDPLPMGLELCKSAYSAGRAQHLLQYKHFWHDRGDAALEHDGSGAVLPYSWSLC